MKPQFEPGKVSYPIALEQLPNRVLCEGHYEVAFARTQQELDEVLKLRFEVFNLELGEGLEASYATGRDEDHFDSVCHHLVVRERDSQRIVGCYRLQTEEMAKQHLGFYSDAEFDLRGLGASVLANSVELGRACVAETHRNSQVLFLLWKGLALYVATNQKRYLFGCSSLTSQLAQEGWALARYLEENNHRHTQLWAPPRSEYKLEAPSPVPLASTKRDVPKLFRTYLRFGAKVCSPPVIDREFKTIDFLTLFDVQQMPTRMFNMFFSS